MIRGATSTSRMERSARLFHSTCQFTCHAGSHRFMLGGQLCYVRCGDALPAHACMHHSRRMHVTPVMRYADYSFHLLYVTCMYGGWRRPQPVACTQRMRMRPNKDSRSTSSGPGASITLKE